MLLRYRFFRPFFVLSLTGEVNATLKNIEQMSEQAENDPVLSKMTSNILEARNLMVEAHGLIESETEKLRREKEAFEEVTKKLEHVHFGSSVKLNVGGTMYRTSLETLRKDADSMLSAMFSGRFDLKPDEDGAYFIDRDGELFR